MSAHTNGFSIRGNVYDRLDYETHATDRLKICVSHKYGNITYKLSTMIEMICI